MDEQEIVMDSVEELAKLLAAMPDNAIVVVSFGEEDTNGKKECI